MDKKYRKILLRMPNPLGDFVMALPAAEGIGRGCPEAELTLMMNPAYLPLVAGMDCYSGVFRYDRKEGGGVSGFLKTAGEIRGMRFDLGVLFTNSFSSALLMKLSGVRERVGYARGGRGWLLTRGLKPKMKNGRIEALPMVDYYGEICRFLGCGSPGRAPRIILTEEEKEAGARFLRERGIDPSAGSGQVEGGRPQGSPLLGLVPGAGYGRAKMWPSGYFAEAGDALAEALGAVPIIFAEAKDAAIAGEIAGAMRHKPLDMSREPLAGLGGGAGNSGGIGLLKQLMGRCALVLTTDSGPRHVAAALGRPVVVVMGSADPIYSETAHEHVVVERVDVECSPCMLRECPTDHRCMTELKPERVVESALRLLGRVGKRGGNPFEERLSPAPPSENSC